MLSAIFVPLRRGPASAVDLSEGGHLMTTTAAPTAAKPPRRPWYTVLYIQVLVARDQHLDVEHRVPRAAGWLGGGRRGSRCHQVSPLGQVDRGRGAAAQRHENRR